MITAAELQTIASEYNYERILREKARIGHTETKLYFATGDLAEVAIKELRAGGFVCTRVEKHYSREGADYSFVAKWDGK